MWRRSAGQQCWAEVLKRSVEQKWWRRVLRKSVGEESRKRILQRRGNALFHFFVQQSSWTLRRKLIAHHSSRAVCCSMPPFSHTSVQSYKHHLSASLLLNTSLPPLPRNTILQHIWVVLLRDTIHYFATLPCQLLQHLCSSLLTNTSVRTHSRYNIGCCSELYNCCKILSNGGV